MIHGSSVFISAADARQSPVGDKTVHTEIRKIEDCILDAVNFGFFETTVSNYTPMTYSTPTVSDVWTVNTTNDQLYIPNHGFKNGDTVVVRSTNVLPAPLNSTSYYYIVYIDIDHVKLANSYVNAMAGRPVSIDITSSLTDILLTNQGNGYLYPPSVTLSGGNSSVTATAMSYLASWGSVVGISTLTSGTGYVDQPTIQIVAEGAGATAGVITYTTVGLSINNAGTDYHAGDLLSISGGSGIPTTALIVSVDSSGAILAANIANPGAYTTLPTLTGAATTVMPGGGTGATINLTMGIYSIAVSSGGSNYSAPPLIIVNDPSGVGVAASAILVGGNVNSINITNPGYGYVGVTSITLTSGSGATAVASLQPVGINSVVLTNNGGYTYSIAPSVTINSVGAGAVAGNVYMSVSSCNIVSPGAGYNQNDILLVSGGTASINATIRVVSVDQYGSILTYVLNSCGSYSILPNPVSNPVTGGTGIQASFNLSFGVGSVLIQSAGSNYVIPPIVNVDAPTGYGETAIIRSALTSGNVTALTIIKNGFGYTNVPNVTITNGSGATAQAVLSPTTLSNITITNQGSGYTYANIIITGGGASSNATANVTVVGGNVSNITITSVGAGYTSPPTIIITGNGIGATAIGQLSYTPVTSISVLSSGSGYNTPPTVTVGGSATAVSTLQSTGVDRIVVTNQGSNYTSDPIVYVIPGTYQISSPTAPTLVSQRGFSLASIAVSTPGVNYTSVPNVTIGEPQISGSIQATANAYIGAGSGTFALQLYPTSMDYFKVWKRYTVSNDQLIRPYNERMESVISYFTNLGYKIVRQINPINTSTMMWHIKW